MKEVFHDVIKTMNYKIDSEEINNYYKKLILNKYMKEEDFKNFHIKYIPNVKYKNLKKEDNISGGSIEITCK